MAAKMSYYIDAPVDTVFELFMDPSLQVEYGPFSGMEVEDSKVTEEGVGTFMSWRVKMVGIPMKGFDVVTGFERNKHITERSSSAMVGTWLYDFAPEGKGTRVTMEHRQQSFWAVPPVRYLTDFLTRRMSRAFIDAVRPQLEAKVPAQRKAASAKARKPTATR